MRIDAARKLSSKYGFDVLFLSGNAPRRTEAGINNAEAAKVIMPKSKRLAPRPSTRYNGIRVPRIPWATPMGKYVRYRGIWLSLSKKPAPISVPLYLIFIVLI
jgi:hypothetical protein